MLSDLGRNERFLGASAFPAGRGLAAVKLHQVSGAHRCRAFIMHALFQAPCVFTHHGAVEAAKTADSFVPVQTVSRQLCSETQEPAVGADAGL